MAWSNGPVTLYHGTDAMSARAIAAGTAPLPHGINLKLCAVLVDFGQGFYTTTFEHQARNWANDRVRRRPHLGPATILEFTVERNRLSVLTHLVFARENSDFWDLVSYARAGRLPTHDRTPAAYDVVWGPVSLWPQTLVIKDCDQISFHTDVALNVLPLPIIRIPDAGAHYFPVSRRV